MKALSVIVCSFLVLGLMGCAIPEKNLAEGAADSNWDATGSSAAEQIEEQMPDLVYESAVKFENSEWLSTTFGIYSIYNDVELAIVTEHRTDGAKWYRDKSADSENWQTVSAADFAYPELPDLANILLELPDEAYAEIRLGSYKGDPCLILPYTDESLPLSPKMNADGGFTDGYKEHEFYFNPHERCLRSYRVCITQFFTGFLDDGKPILVAPPNLYWLVFDFDYQPVALPSP